MSSHPPGRLVGGRGRAGPGAWPSGCPPLAGNRPRGPGTAARSAPDGADGWRCGHKRRPAAWRVWELGGEVVPVTVHAQGGVYVWIRERARVCVRVR